MIFKSMDKDQDGTIACTEFVHSNKQDSALAKVYPPPSAASSHFRDLTLRLQALLYHYFV